MSRVGALSGASVEEMQRLTDTAKRLGAEQYSPQVKPLRVCSFWRWRILRQMT
ncbi:hypothetical protein [Paenibacillus melissococcoides]|uniref:hypothetical protein n=1 Tax=Paenibacillus melissococcoides TaxID=2912268 RepID=UPI0021C2C2F8|nr:hypothetical protein [Paenibacillus melissococcoides]